MADITFPLSTSPGLRPQEGAGRLVNAFAEPRGEDLGPVWRRAPGASPFSDTAFANFRGGLLVGSTLLAAYTDTLKSINSSGVVSAVDALSGSDRVTMARNNATTPDVAIVTNTGAFVYDSSGPDTDAYPDGDVGSPNCVTSFDGYLMFGYGNGDIQASDLNSTNINTLNRASAESNPDGIVRLWPYNGHLYAAGEKTIEVWGYPVNVRGFPLTRVGYHVTPGLKASHAVAGWEPEFGEPPLYVGSDNSVRQISGLSSEKVSPPDLDRLIAAETDPTALDAFTFIVGGHKFWQLNGSTWSWVYHLNAQKWHERQSYQTAGSLLTGSVFAFDKWLVGHSGTAKLQQMSSTVHTENAMPLIFAVESIPVKDFPNRMRVPRADFDFVVGVGIAGGLDPMQIDPTVLIQWSDDGYNWSLPWERKLGRQGKTQTRIILPPTGMTGTQGRRWRLSVSDPVHVGLMGGRMYEKLMAA